MRRLRDALAATVLLGLAAMACAQTDPTPEACLGRLSAQVGALLKKSPPPLFEWHLKSLLALATAEHAKLSIASATDRTPLETRRKEFVQYVTVICNGLDGDAADPDMALKEGRRGLVLARLSRIDGTLQTMQVDLPKGWDPARAYPLFVGLHGSGPENPLAYPSFALGPATPPAAGAPAKPTDGMIRLAPWGRGNRGWRGDAERDLFEAIELLQTFAKLDPDRWYLTGHSSGADGAWAILQHTPDLWAAVGLQSGSMLSGRPEWGLVPNMTHVPVHILIGENDDLPFRIPDSKEAHRLLKEAGGETKLVILPGVGHYPLTEEALDEQAAWMTRFVRKRPDRFAFTVDQSEHPGVWGITVPFGRGERFVKEPWPTFTCEVKGQEVRIVTKNAKRLRVDLGLNGLRMAGDVVLWVNGKRAFAGPVPKEPLEPEV